MHDLGIIGMAVMGRNLAMNAASKGINVAVYNRTTSRMEEAVEEASKQGLTLHGYKSIPDFVQALTKPRKVILMVQSGSAVDATLDILLASLDQGDIVVDGGNEFYANTDRRDLHAFSTNKVMYMGMGVSGGEEGARHGPSIMPGGDPAAFAHMEPILSKLAAVVDGKVCCAYMGRKSAGNYVKMVHNGIEYGDMQLIAEAYDLLKGINGLNNQQMAEVFAKWNQGLLKSYLIDITTKILTTKCPEGFHILDVILDSAGSKGTGKWTSQEAAEKGVPCPTIQAALDSRYLSSFLNLRKASSDTYGHARNKVPPLNLEDLEGALYCSKICSYAQGLMLLKKASQVHTYEIDLGKVASIWVGGCIIRADFLKEITAAFEKNKDLDNLLLDEYFSTQVKKYTEGWRRVVVQAQQTGIPIPALSTSLNYYDAFRAETLPLNLVQAQRDCFGAHTFERKDKQGKYHADWDTGVIHPV